MEVIVIGENRDNFALIEEPTPAETPPDPGNEKPIPGEPEGSEGTFVEQEQLRQPVGNFNVEVRSMAHSGANGGWAWVQNLALVEIADEGRVSGLKRMLARSVYLALCQLDNGHAEGPKGVVIASQATLAKYACCDRRSIPSGVTELERAGVISVTRRTKPGQKCA
jgi:hypothetical protein